MKNNVIIFIVISAIFFISGNKVQQTPLTVLVRKAFAKKAITAQELHKCVQLATTLSYQNIWGINGGHKNKNSFVVVEASRNDTIFGLAYVFKQGKLIKNYTHPIQIYDRVTKRITYTLGGIISEDGYPRLIMMKISTIKMDTLDEMLTLQDHKGYKRIEVDMSE